MMLAGEAFEVVRKEVASEAGGLGKGGMWALRGNAERLSEAISEIRNRPVKDHRKLGRAMNLREFLRELWNYASRELAEAHFESWYSWARRCRLGSFKKLSITLKEHWDGILDYYENWTTIAAIEAIKGKLQLARKRARGYCNFENFRAIAYWIAGEIQVATNLPKPLPDKF
jgi:transposase